MAEEHVGLKSGDKQQYEGSRPKERHKLPESSKLAPWLRSEEI
jgi:hypothetical protein